MNRETSMIHERFGFVMFVEVWGCAGGPSGGVFQGELLREDLINYLSRDEHLWWYSVGHAQC